MELHRLRYFCAVAETGSFSRAAEQSHVSQPALSQQIMKLEGELGARLFDRLGRSVRLTDVGKTFLPRARSVLRELEAAKGDVVERKDSISGLVTVGVIPTVAPYFLPSRLTSFSRPKSPSLRTVPATARRPLLSRHRRRRLRSCAPPSPNCFRKRPIQQLAQHGRRGHGSFHRPRNGHREKISMPLRPHCR